MTTNETKPPQKGPCAVCGEDVDQAVEFLRHGECMWHGTDGGDDARCVHVECSGERGTG